MVAAHNPGLFIDNLRNGSGGLVQPGLLGGMSFVRVLCAVHVGPLAQVGLEARRTDDIRRGKHTLDTGKGLWKCTSIGGLAFEELRRELSGGALSIVKGRDGVRVRGLD